MVVGLWRRALAACAVVGMVALASGCTGSDQAVGTDGVVSTSPAPATSAAPVTVAPLTNADAGDGPVVPAGNSSDVAPASSPAPTTPVEPTTSSTPPPPPAVVTASPALGSTDVSPAEPIDVSVADGTLMWVKFVTPEGKDVAGTLSDDGTQWKLGEKLGFGKTYAISGVARNAAGVQTPFDSTYTTATTREPVTVSISPRDGAVVGVAAPIIVTMGMPATDKKLIESNVKVVTDPPVEGSWAWVQHAGFDYPQLDWRPKDYWPAGTKVHVEANLYGLKFSDGWYGGSDVSVDFTIGRNQIVKADATKNLVQVFRDGKIWATYNGSFGKGDVNGDKNLVTRSGIHVVTSKHETYKMSNPQYGYEDVTEYWAVRISNNGEFLHNNPGTTKWQLANVNKTHGCINLSWDDAKAYFESAIYGDPVEITGTSVQLSRADGDIYDWTISWDDWQKLSALSPDSTVLG